MLTSLFQILSSAALVHGRYHLTMSFFPIFNRRADKTEAENKNELAKNKKHEDYRDYDLNRRKRTYNEAWLKDYPWHRLQIKDDGIQVLICRPTACRSESERRGGDMGRAKSELVDGSTVIKNFTLTRHDRSEAHQLCMQREAARLN